MKKIILIITLLLFSCTVNAEITTYPKEVVNVMISKDTIGFDKKIVKVDNVVYSISKNNKVEIVLKDDSADAFTAGVFLGCIICFIVFILIRES